MTQFVRPLIDNGVATIPVATAPVAADAAAWFTIVPVLPCITAAINRECFTTMALRDVVDPPLVRGIVTAPIGRDCTTPWLRRIAVDRAPVRSVTTVALSRRVSGPATINIVTAAPYAVCPPNPMGLAA